MAIHVVTRDGGVTVTEAKSPRHLLEMLYGLERGDSMPAIMEKMVEYHNGDWASALDVWRKYHMSQYFEWRYVDEGI